MHLLSTVLGCRVEAVVESGAPCIEVAESILACVESLLSTSVLQRIVPRVPRFDIVVRHSMTAEWPFDAEFREEAGLPVLEVRCVALRPDGMTQDEQAK